MNKGSSDFMEGSYSLHVRILDALLAEGIAVVEMFLSRSLTWPSVRNCGLKLLTVSHHLAKSGSYRPCCRIDIRELIFHVTLREHVIKGLCEFMKGSSSLHIPTLPSLVATGSGYTMDVWFASVTWSCKTKPYGHVTLWVEPAHGRSPPGSFDAIGIVVVEI